MYYFTESYGNLTTADKIKVLETELQLQQQKKIDEDADAMERAELLNNTLSSMFDGLKFSNTAETAIEMTFPMIAYPNLYYKYDGHTYVCMPYDKTLTQLIVTNETFNEMNFALWS